MSIQTKQQKKANKIKKNQYLGKARYKISRLEENNVRDSIMELVAEHREMYEYLATVSADMSYGDKDVDNRVVGIIPNGLTHTGE